MGRRVYTAESLTDALHEFERHYGLSSHDFCEQHVADAGMSIPRFERHVWASFYADVIRLDGDDAVMDRVSRSFAVPA